MNIVSPNKNSIFQKGPVNYQGMFETGKRHPINPNCKDISGVAGDDKGTYFEYAFEDAPTFLAAFDLQSELYDNNGDHRKPKFFFRGHEDSTWSLIPSVYRNLDEKNSNMLFNKDDFFNDLEINPLLKFAASVNDLGYLVDEKIIDLVNARESVSDGSAPTYAQMRSLVEQPNDFPQKEHLSLLACRHDCSIGAITRLSLCFLQRVELTEKVLIQSPGLVFGCCQNNL